MQFGLWLMALCKNLGICGIFIPCAVMSSCFLFMDSKQPRNLQNLNPLKLTTHTSTACKNIQFDMNYVQTLYSFLTCNNITCRFTANTGHNRCLLATLCLQLCDGSWTFCTTCVWIRGTASILYINLDHLINNWLSPMIFFTHHYVLLEYAFILNM